MAQSNFDDSDPGSARDPRLASFASGGCYGRGRPEAGIASALEAVTDGSGRPPGAATDDEVIGMLGCWQALEAHAHARLLAVARELIRRRPLDGCPVSYPGALPAEWLSGAAHEVAAELAMSWQAAEPMLHLAWQLEARLADIGRLLDEGVLTAFKVKIVTDEFSVLDDEKAAEAQAQLLECDLGAADMTPGRLRKLCQRIADTVDPEGARRRREDARREKARVSFFRNHGGDTAMFAEGLPPDEALMAQANIQARAVDYQRSQIYPEAGMDLLRVLGMLDLINGATLDERIAKYYAKHAAREDASQREQRARDRETAGSLARYRSGAPPATGNAGDSGPGSDLDWPEPPVEDEAPPDEDDCELWPGFPPPGDAPEPGRPADPGDDDIRDAPPDEDSPDEDSPGGDSTHGDSTHGDSTHGDSPDGDSTDGDSTDEGGSGGVGRGRGPGRGPGGVPGRTREPGLPALTHLTMSLATLMGLGQAPGEVPGYGSVDPALSRDLADAAAESPRTKYCFTVTDEKGHAAGHACGQRIREPRSSRDGPGSRDGPAAPGGWDLVPDDTRPGPEGGYGAWILTVPGGMRYRLDVHPVPLHRCDHRFATDSYRPGALLRHLVGIRDGECTFTGCSHPARQCDFEHGTPWHKGGVTDACNGAPRSRRCHQVKQSLGWSVSQPEPGRHLWHTPSGRTYEKGPKSYPA